MNRYEGIADGKQREYITSHLNESMFVEAGAGAGKTTLIIERIVAQLVAGVKPEEIAAITFTTAAAEELRGRIVAEVKKRSVSNKKLTSVLHNIENMQISTIHSFCATLLKERCFEAGLPIGAKVLEEDDDEIRKGKIFDLWLTTLNEDELKEMYWVSDTSNKQAKRVIFDNFSKLVDVSEYYNIYGSSEGDISELKKSFVKEYEDIIEEEITYCRELFDNFFAVRDGWFKEAQTILGVDDPIKRITKGANVGKNEKWDILDIAENIYTSIKNDEFVKKIPEVIELIKKGNPTKDKVYFQTGDEKDNINNLHNRIKEEYTGLKGKKGNKKDDRTGIVGLVVFTDRETYDKKKEKALTILKYSLLARKFYFENLPVKELNNNQLLEKAYELLKDEEVRKYFYNKFKCVYVDEFQDTDPLQESIVWNLTTLGNAENLKEGKLFVVGDPKQAIYRFRGADPVIYFKVKDRFEQSPHAGVFRLSINYRSNNKLIDYVNDFFADKGILWEEEESENSSSNPGGYEEMEAAEGRDIPDNLEEKELAGAYMYLVEGMNTKEADIEDEISDIESEEADTEDENATEDSEKDDGAAEKIPELVEALVEGKYKIRDGNKGFREICYSDFLVLFDKHRGMGKYVEEFSKRGIKTQVLGEINLEEVDIINHFLRLYKAIAHSHNKEYRTGAVELLKLKLYEGKAAPESGLKLTGFEEDIYEAAANNIIDELVEAVKGLSAYGKAAYLAEKFDLFFVGKEQPYTYIISSQTKLQQLIENMFAEDKGNTVAFIRKTEQYISDLLDRELVLENNGTDVVRLMNYHKAKGLQGKIVILPPKSAKKENDETDYRKDDNYYPLITWGCDGWRGIKGSTCSFMGPEEIKEEAKSADRSEKIRLDYVAKTRAEEVLIFIGDENTEEDVERLEIPIINEEKVEHFAEYERNAVFSTEGKDGIAYHKFNPSGFENTSKTRAEAYIKAKESGIEKFTRDEIRPSGNVIGTVLHRALELLIERLGLSTDDENLAVICAKQAVNEFKKDITEGIIGEAEKLKELNRYREFLPKAVRALESYIKEKYGKDISDKNVKIFTELPFSFYEADKSDELKKIEEIRLKEDEIAVDGAAWINGTADLIFVYGDRAIVFDYKSDLADYITEKEDFEKTLEERYTGQLALYRYAVNKLYGIDKDKIELKLLYFKDYGDGLKVCEKEILENELP